jgi:Cu2+-exporting ATPase
MDLVQQTCFNVRHSIFCPMHPEIVQDPGDCPICGMDLVPMKPTESEDKTYISICCKMKIASVFTLPFYHSHVRYDS